MSPAPTPRGALVRAAFALAALGMAVLVSGCIVVPYRPFHPYRYYYY